LENFWGRATNLNKIITRIPLSACFAAWTRIFANYTNSHELFYIVSKAALALYRFIIHFQNRESQNSHIVVASCIRHPASCILYPEFAFDS